MSTVLQKIYKKSIIKIVKKLEFKDSEFMTIIYFQMVFKTNSIIL